MLLMYNKSFSHEDLVKETVKDLKIKVFKPEDFDTYVKQIKDSQDKDVVVAFNTKLKSVSPDTDTDSKDYLAIEDKYFEVLPAKDKKASFYIPIDEYTFVRVEKKNVLIPILLVCLTGCVLIGGSIWYNNRPIEEEPNTPIEMDDSQQTGQGEEIRTSDSEFYQESTVIPGFAEIEAAQGADLIPLSNPEENTVNFVYTILKEESSEVDKTFTDATEASNYISENTVEYKNVEENGQYLLELPNGEKTTEFVEYKTKENGDKIDVVKNTYKLVYFTKGIAPGNHVDWPCYEYLGSGDFNVQFRISTTDVETDAQCYGAVQSVHIMIK